MYEVNPKNFLFNFWDSIQYKGQDNSQKSKVERIEGGAGDGESGELYSPEKEERRESGLNPDKMNITLRGGNGLWMRMFY